MLLVLKPERAQLLLGDALQVVTGYFGWLYLLVGFGAIAVLVWLAFSRYGRVKLGAPDDGPEFSTPSWIAMMFTVGIGIGLTNWAFVEPIFYFQSPPFGVEAGTPEAAEWAHMYGQFHWSIVPWAIYALPALPIAYSLYVRKQPSCRVSTASGECVVARNNAQESEYELRERPSRKAADDGNDSGGDPQRICPECHLSPYSENTRPAIAKSACWRVSSITWPMMTSLIVRTNSPTIGA